MMKDKKGFALGDMLPLAITIVVIGVALSLGLTVLTDFKASQTANSDAANGTQKAIDGLNKFTQYLPTIALVVVIAVIIGILVRYLAGGGSN